jgi:glycosyltransferase involved in cell wall biosynthesis
VSVSVVLITRNQERTIGRLIESVLRETADLAVREVILVDSASSDRTVEIALGYPIAVLGLAKGDWLSPAAGRYAGFASTTGAGVLFLDGDMELCEGWLAPALQALTAVPSLAAVAGRVVDANRGVADLPTNPLRPQMAGEEPAWELPHPSGAALYRRAALEQVGSFNPYLRSDEEPELALRLRARGYQILALDRPSVVHYEPVTSGLSALLGRRRRGLFLGQGQVVRALLGRPALLRYLRERGYFVAPLAAATAGGAAAAASAVRRNPRWIALWALLVATTLGREAVRRRSIRATALAAFNRVLFVEGLIRGFSAPLGDPELHPVTTQQYWIRPPAWG